MPGTQPQLTFFWREAGHLNRAHHELTDYTHSYTPFRKRLELVSHRWRKIFAVHTADKDLKSEAIKNFRKSEINKQPFLKVGERL